MANSAAKRKLRREALRKEQKAKAVTLTARELALKAKIEEEWAAAPILTPGMLYMVNFNGRWNMTDGPQMWYSAIFGYDAYNFDWKSEAVICFLEMKVAKLNAETDLVVCFYFLFPDGTKRYRVYHYPVARRIGLEFCPAYSQANDKPSL